MPSVPNSGTGALTVKIFDERNTLLYEGTEVIDGNFAKLYNLNKIDGEPIFEISDQNGNANAFNHNLSLKISNGCKG